MRQYRNRTGGLPRAIILEASVYTPQSHHPARHTKFTSLLLVFKGCLWGSWRVEIVTYLPSITGLPYGMSSAPPSFTNFIKQLHVHHCVKRVFWCWVCAPFPLHLSTFTTLHQRRINFLVQSYGYAAILVSLLASHPMGRMRNRSHEIMSKVSGRWICLCLTG